jgi:hypothetical protein
MAKRAGKLLILLFFLMGVGTATASAQLIGALDVNVPHPFFVNNTKLPAGKYSVRVLDDLSANMMEMQSMDGRTSVMFDTEDAQPKDEPRASKLVFNKVGNDYFLSRIWLDGDSYVGYALEKTKLEKKLEGSGAKSERHEVAINRKPGK